MIFIKKIIIITKLFNKNGDAIFIIIYLVGGIIGDP